MTLENAVINNGGLKQYASSVVLKSPRKMAAAFALSVVQDSIQRLDSCQQQDDYSSLVLRLEYLNRTIVNSGKLPDSGISHQALAIRCLQEQQEAVTRGSCSRVARTFTGRPGRPSFQVHVEEEQLSYLVESGFTVPQISELLEVSMRTVERRMSHFGIRISGKT